MTTEQPAWGAATEMNAAEALMWRTEADPRLRSQGILLEVLDRAPAHDRVRAAHEWASHEFPRLRQRVVEDPLGIAAPQWVMDPDFDLAYHLRFARVTEPGTMRQVLDMAEVFYMTPFDRTRPLWESLLIEGLEDGTACFLLKLHHSVADGTGIVQLIELAHSHTAEPSRRETRALPAVVPVDGRSLGAKSLRELPVTGLRTAVKAGGLLTGAGAKALADPVGTASSVLGYGRSLGRVLGPPPSPGSPLFTERSLGRRLGVMDIELDVLRAAGKSVGGSLNDAFVAAMCGGVGRYHAAHGSDIDTITLALPVSTRKPDDPPGSNKFAGARVAGPIGPMEPAERMSLISRRVRAAREEPALDFLGVLSPPLAKVPGQITGPMTLQLTKSIDLQASNIPGLRREAWLAGAKVTHTYPFGAIPGPAMMATLLSHERTCCIGVTADAAAVADFDGMMTCLQEGLDEVAALAGRDRSG